MHLQWGWAHPAHPPWEAPLLRWAHPECPSPTTSIRWAGRWLPIRRQWQLIRRPEWVALLPALRRDRTAPLPEWALLLEWVALLPALHRDSTALLPEWALLLEWVIRWALLLDNTADRLPDSTADHLPDSTADHLPADSPVTARRLSPRTEAVSRPAQLPW
jgi:hypothetical protein